MSGKLAVSSIFCECLCHKTGIKSIKTSIPPQPCCNCFDPISYHPDPYFPGEEAVSPMVKQIQKLEERIKEIERFQEITHLQYKVVQENKKLHKCPVCDGKRKELSVMPNGGYFEFDCKPCEGKGIIWSC